MLHGNLRKHSYFIRFTLVGERDQQKSSLDGPPREPLTAQVWSESDYGDDAEDDDDDDEDDDNDDNDDDDD